MSNLITLPKAVDCHVHLRGFGEGELGPDVLPYSLAHTQGIVAIGNVPAIATVEEAVRYIGAVHESDKRAIGRLKLAPMIDSEVTTARVVQLMADALEDELAGFKFMFKGASTGGAYGVSAAETAINNLESAFAEMQARDIPVLIHGELLPAPELDDRAREENFLSVLRDLHSRFPKLRISLEHVSTERALRCIEELHESSDGRVMCTITTHHLGITWADVLTNQLRSDLLCRPPAKQEDDRLALNAAVFSGASHVMHGTDSAPHARTKKHQTNVPCGVFSAPIAIIALVDQCLRDAEDNHLDPNWKALGDFLARGAEFYGFDLDPDETIMIDLNGHTQVPRVIAGVEVYLGGSKLRGQVIENSERV